MPCQLPSITIGPDQQEDGFLVKARNEYSGGVNPAPGLQPSLLHPSLLLSFPPSHSMRLVCFSDATVTPDQKKHPRNEVLPPFTDHIFFLLS